MKAPTTPQRRPRSRPVHLGFTIHASRGIAHGLATMFHRLANGTPKQRQAADDFRQAIREMKGATL